mmetsp:Transcript_55202/g.170976  ORF Transcript_55202/g.170976 Transcript_55202/m.170976 type:complete len:385 (-) Transcript_55202:346-1500(-)
MVHQAALWAPFGLDADTGLPSELVLRDSRRHGLCRLRRHSRSCSRAVALALVSLVSRVPADSHVRPPLGGGVLGPSPRRGLPRARPHHVCVGEHRRRQAPRGGVGRPADRRLRAPGALRRMLLRRRLRAARPRPEPLRGEADARAVLRPGGEAGAAAGGGGVPHRRRRAVPRRPLGPQQQPSGEGRGRRGPRDRVPRLRVAGPLPRHREGERLLLRPAHVHLERGRRGVLLLHGRGEAVPGGSSLLHRLLHDGPRAGLHGLLLHRDARLHPLDARLDVPPRPRRRERPQRRLRDRELPRVLALEPAAGPRRPLLRPGVQRCPDRRLRDGLAPRHADDLAVVPQGCGGHGLRPPRRHGELGHELGRLLWRLPVARAGRGATRRGG